MLRRALFTAAMLASTAALAQTPNDGPPPARCGATLTDEGACYGDVAAWCELPNLAGDAPDASVRLLDCAALSLGGEPIGARCVALPGLGATCGVARGAPCALPSQDGVVQLACLADGALDTGAVCDLDRGCVAGPLCVPSLPACDDDGLLLACAAFGQALVVDCASLGGACAAGACVDVEEGGRCGAELSCAEALTCVGAEGGLGTCLREGAPQDPVEPRAEDPAPPPAPSCAGIHAASGAAPLGWLALAALGFLGGWRGKRASDRCRSFFPL